MDKTDANNMRRTALVTGASGGIGYELARLIAADGHDLVLVSRNETRLKEVAGELEEAFRVRTALLPKDLAVPDSPEQILAELEKASIEIDVLVNNAGFGTSGPFSQSPLSEQLEMIQLNVTSLVHLTGLLLPRMIERSRGKVVNVSSVAAFQPGPFMAVYYATKSFVLSFSEAIASELEGTGVTVTAVCPGPTVTDFQNRAGTADTNLFRNHMTMDAPAVARIAYEGVKKNKPVVITGAKNKFLAFGNRLVPRSLVVKIARSLNEHRKR
ncbi:MAG: SDR family oxidoreductase [Candidatus Latescibacterota bacterium]|nr:MAG: SDR family oxidoreductase [Candidatus Latescibacterota bacterium]